MAQTPEFKETPSQTAGPYVHIGCAPNAAGFEATGEYDLGSHMVNDLSEGERIRVFGHIYDGAGDLVIDAMIEVWQANAKGYHASPVDQRGACDPEFRGWGRQTCDFRTGLYELETIRPGRVPTGDGVMQAPHLSLWIVARGINIGLNTRVYFSDEDNSDDPVLALVDEERRHTLIAEKVADGYQFDIRLQGDDETVFFDI